MFKFSIVKKVSNVRRLFYLVLTVFSLLTSGNIFAEEQTKKKDIKPSQKIYFAIADQHQRPLTEERESFACSDKIFTVIELSHYPIKKYQLSVRWYDPANKLRENTQYPFTISKEKTRLWAWLSLSRGTGAGMWQWINPAAGLEDFVGPWKVEVYINNKRVDSKEFSVDC